MTRLPPLVACTVLVCAVTQHAAAGPGQDAWWQDPATQRDLTLTTTQVSAIERLFASTLAEQRRLGKALARLEQNLQQAIAADALDEAALTRTVDELEAMRAKRNATRTLMLFRMYRTLSPTQRLRLREIQRVGARARRREDSPSAE